MGPNHLLSAASQSQAVDSLIKLTFFSVETSLAYGPNKPIKPIKLPEFPKPVSTVNPIIPSLSPSPGPTKPTDQITSFISCEATAPSSLITPQALTLMHHPGLILPTDALSQSPTSIDRSSTPLSPSHSIHPLPSQEGIILSFDSPSDDIDQVDYDYTSDEGNDDSITSNSEVNPNSTPYKTTPSSTAPDISLPTSLACTIFSSPSALLSNPNSISQPPIYNSSHNSLSSGSVSHISETPTIRRSARIIREGSTAIPTATKAAFRARKRALEFLDQSPTPSCESDGPLGSISLPAGYEGLSDDTFNFISSCGFDFDQTNPLLVERLKALGEIKRVKQP